VAEPAIEEALAKALRRAQAEGEPVAVATVLSGPSAGRRLLVWSAGQVFGDLGWPRLNQRVALFAEVFLEGVTPTVRKKFDAPDGEVEVLVEVAR